MNGRQSSAIELRSRLSLQKDVSVPMLPPRHGKRLKDLPSLSSPIPLSRLIPSPQSTADQTLSNHQINGYERLQGLRISRLTMPFASLSSTNCSAFGSHFKGRLSRVARTAR